MREARLVGVSDFIAMGVDGETSRQALATACIGEGVWAAAGHHPSNQQGPDLSLLRELALHPRTVAIGEIGLDHVDENRGPHDEQAKWFRASCRLALELGLPVSVHTRGCEQEVYEVLREHAGITGVMHYWTLDRRWAELFLELGLYISFAGILTRASRFDLRQVAANVPGDRILLESDAPWGTPRGRSGSMQPAWLLDTAVVLAGLRGLEVAELARLERANAEALFPKLRASKPGVAN
ncbi:MAG: TatD family hydrolase [Candidatus Dormibacteraeota bacterium]|nr:TatD family hydrolase [Candidatus Dormibacteraeota bacterium]